MKMETIGKSGTYAKPRLRVLPAQVAIARLAAAGARLTPSNARQSEPDAE